MPRYELDCLYEDLIVNNNYNELVLKKLITYYDNLGISEYYIVKAMEDLNCDVLFATQLVYSLLEDAIKMGSKLNIYGTARIIYTRDYIERQFNNSLINTIIKDYMKKKNYELKEVSSYTY